MVENVEGFGPELEVHRFADGEALEQTQVDVRVAWPMVCADVAVAKVALRWQGKSSRIQPQALSRIVGCSGASVADAIRAMQAPATRRG